MGEQIDRALLKNILDIFVGIGNGKMEYYVNDFEDPILRDSLQLIISQSFKLIDKYSYSNYLLKAEECLKKEKDRVSHYLHVSSLVTKLLRKNMKSGYQSHISTVHLLFIALL
ncbi:Cullin-1 [Datura stramonium]|uniref:Cullin-1 n=1 Tax=Datura stramonium TaxID=4076 RepID=A0ABS8UI32_DATST|nr:Cullin-1 [Datura stramonium]